MRIKFFSQYFWPENFRINDLVLYLKDNDFDIDIVTSQPSYPNKSYFKNKKTNKTSQFKKLKITRLPVIKRSRSNFSIFLNYLSFFFSISAYCFAMIFKRKDYDFFFIFCPSPIITSLPVIVLSRIFKIKIIIWVLDLWPSTLKDLGIIKNKFILNILEKLIKYIYNSSDLILVQSKSFYKTIGKISQTKKHIFYSWPEQNSLNLYNISNNINKLPGYTYIVFTGNVGQAQGLSYLIESAKLISKKSLRVKWVIVGDGRDYQNIKKLIKMYKLDDDFLLVGNIESKDVTKYFKIADALFISLVNNETFSKTIPGKLQTYMNTGIPILAMISGEAQEIIKTAKCGLVVDSGDVINFSKIVEDFINLNTNEKEKLGRNAKLFVEKNFSKSEILKDFKNLIIEMKN